MEEKKSIWNFFDRIRADKVLLIIIIGLVLMSILAIFSSTSTLVTEKNSRLAIFGEQLIVVGLGVLVMFVCYKIPNIKVFRVFSQIGFIVSFGFLVFLVSHASIGPIKAQEINGTYRTIGVGGFQIAVFEVVKVLMVLYIGWAVQAWKEDRFGIANKLAAAFPGAFGWLEKKIAKEIVYIYLPIAIICFLLLKAGSNSSLFICGGVMFTCLLIGGFDAKKAILLGLIGIGGIVAAYGLNVVSKGKIFSSLRVETLASRIDLKTGKSFEEQLAETQRGSREWRGLIDRNLQIEGAKIAIHEGGILGKGAGNSTQKYIVPQIFGDYMFSFICEEYGIWGALIILILFGSLLARGCFIASNCDGVYARTVVGGFCVLISGQAMMHILVNVGIFPMTGQTLPLISDGKGAFLMFSLAFGILLSISKFAMDNFARAEAERLAAEEAEMGEFEEENLLDESINHE